MQNFAPKPIVRKILTPVFLTKGFGAKFYRPDSLPDANQKNHVLGFNFSASTAPRDGEGVQPSAYLAPFPRQTAISVENGKISNPCILRPR